MNPHGLEVEAGKSEGRYWRDVFLYRELFLFLAWRDILVRYKQTVIGVAWSIIRPLLTMLVFVLIFGRIAELPDGGVPYPILVFAAMLPWQFFSNALTESSNSLVANANMVSKVYFPRILMPASSIAVACVDFLISTALLGILMAIYTFAPSSNIWAFPLFTILAFLTALGPGLLLSSLNVKYRDFRYIVPFLVQFGLYVSPVGFSSDVAREKLGDYGLLYSINPMVGVIDGFRWCICGGEKFPLDVSSLLVSSGMCAFFLVIGIATFRRSERAFADVI